MPVTTGSALPLPDLARSTVVVAAPGPGDGYWAGAPSAVLDDDGSVLLAYRLRRPVGRGRGYANVIARSMDGERFTTLTEVHKEDFGAASLERPALVRRPDGGWRLYVSCSVPGSLSWWIDAVDADRPDAFDPTTRRRVLTGDEAVAYKDPVVLPDGSGWHAWICRHDIADPAEADRMHTVYATSADGLDWELHGPALSPRPGTWDQRGARVSAVVPAGDGTVTGYYDGRASSAQNWYETTGTFRGPYHRLTADGDGPVATSPHGGGALRYLSVVDVAGGGHRLYFEAAGPAGAHDVRTQLVPPTPGP